jgi:hypothetical protein
MPAQNKAQRRLFALAIQFKRGEIPASEVSDEVKDLSKIPEDKLRDYAKTKETDLPDYVEENAILNPNMNVQSMGDVVLPENPGSADSFSTQKVGSGDNPNNIKKKKIKLLSFDQFLDLMIISKI